MECAHLNISLLEPKDPDTVPLGEAPLAVMVTLGCGCPVTAGGRWDSRRFQVHALIETEADGCDKVQLMPVLERPSEFRGSVELHSPGRRRVSIEAYDPETGLAGRLAIELVAVTSPAIRKTPCSF